MQNMSPVTLEEAAVIMVGGVGFARLKKKKQKPLYL